MKAPTIGEVIAEHKKREADTAKREGMCVIGTVHDFATGKIKEAYLYVQTGGDRMLKIRSASAQGDVWTGTGLCSSWWCSCSDTPIYFYKGK